MILEFIKMHGLGNDFVIINNIGNPHKRLSTNDIKTLCHRNFGIGCDQLIIMESCDVADCLMRIYNPDGSESGACGNATRCVAKLLNLPSSTIRIGERTLRCTLHKGSGQVTVNMGPYSPPTSINALGCDGYFIDVGNPHFVYFVNDLDSYDVTRVGEKLEKCELFPNRANINFVEIANGDSIKLRVWERGAGETLACGSGACASAIIAHQYKGLANQINVHLKGGTLGITVQEQEVLMRGDTQKIFNGNYYK
ncbi:MAG: diaminopimelate epimerase [Candidatus Jidaibacter sp.]|jgi:diaminopimelate epimerase|nr:diaminopimelate epimerase [Candidatus Jidaibacter sp.]